MFKKLFLLIVFLVTVPFIASYFYIRTYASGYVSYEFIDETQSVEYKHVKYRPKNWINLNNLAKRSYGGIVVSEDWGFYQHNGLDFLQLKKAIIEGVKGKRFRGASTITQQLVKNLFLSHERSLVRKSVEAYLAIVMDLALSKHRILELYLNIVEFGKGIYGISDASLYYFSILPENVSSRQGAFLAMLLPNPKIYSQSFKDKEMTEFANESVKEILNKMRIAKFITDQEYSKSLEDSFNWEPKTVELSDLEYYQNQQ